MKAERARREWLRDRIKAKVIYTEFYTMAQKMNQYAWQLALAILLPIPHQCPSVIKWLTTNGDQSDPGCTVERVLSMSCWWGINVIWHNGRMRKEPGLPSTQWQAHTGVWPRGRDPKWGEPKARSRVRWQGQVRVRRESLRESQAWPLPTQVGTFVPKPFCTVKTCL